MLLTGFKIKGLTGLYGVYFATIAKLHGTLYHISKLLTLLRQIYFRTATRMILGQLFCRPMAYSQTREAFMT